MLCVTKGSLRGETISGLFVFCLFLTACSDSADPGVVTSPANTLPLAVDDAFTVVKGDTMTLDLVANDTDVDDGLDVASVAIVEAANGSVEINTDGTVTYTHDGSDAVSDRFTYTVMDFRAAVSNRATVSISVLPEAPAAVEVGVYSATIVEGADDLEFVISLAETSPATVSVDFATVAGTAVDGEDYSAKSGVVQFAPGERRKFITVPVVENTSTGGASSKQLQLVLSQPQYAFFGVNTATGTIIDSDAMAMETAYNARWGAVGAFTNAAKCGEACHKTNGADMSFDGKDISPGTQWRHSVMANSFNDPYWQAAVQDESETFPALSGFIEDTCTSCHAPMGRTHAHQANSNLDSDGYYRFDQAKNENHAREGVSCTLCHQIANINLGAEQSFSGKYIIADSSDADYKRIYGQYAGPVGNNMNMQTGHRPTEGPHVAESALCATCHTLYTPALDPETGMPSGIDFLEQGPFLEWQNSDYATAVPATHCQDCHMPEPAEGYQTAISLRPPHAPGDRTPYGQHSLLGGNAHLLEILRDYRTELGIDGATTADGFNEQIALTRTFLGSAATVFVSEPEQVGNQLNFAVEVTNETGHKLPSSYPSRRAWLHVTVKNGGGNVIFESGKPDARGYISTDQARLKADCMSKEKLDGFNSSLCYEPHRDLIDDPSQVAIYETVLGDTHGTITHTLLLGAQYLKDNRIPPAGFTNARAETIEPQTIPSGVDGDSDFNCVAAAEGCGADTVRYQVNTVGQAGPYSVEVSLLYQATQPGFVDGMHTHGDRVNRFKVMYDAVPPSVEVLATAAR